MIIIPSGVRTVICLNKDPYQATSIVSAMVCEMHHGFGTLLNCYPGGVLAYTGVGKMPQKMAASKGTEVVVSTTFRIVQLFAVRP